MKSKIYKAPVVSAIIIHGIILIACIYSAYKGELWAVVPVIFLGTTLGSVHRRILDNVPRRKKNIIFISYFLMLAICIVYTISINILRRRELVERLLL